MIYIRGETKPCIKVTVEVETDKEERVIALLQEAMNTLSHLTEAERHGIGRETHVLEYGHFTITRKTER